MDAMYSQVLGKTDLRVVARIFVGDVIINYYIFREVFCRI